LLSFLSNYGYAIVYSSYGSPEFVSEHVTSEIILPIEGFFACQAAMAF